MNSPTNTPSQSASDAPPYRGAYGFRPAAESEADRAFAGYASPYALLLEAIGDMLNCDVAEVLLEDACPLDDVFELAGAVRLVERGGGGVHVVDCYADEALGLALAAQCAVHATRDVVDACGVAPTFGLERRTAVAPLKLRLRADDDRPRASHRASLAHIRFAAMPNYIEGEVWTSAALARAGARLPGPAAGP